MKTEGGNYYTWDDVIFENRNRSYGAYLVRQSYSRNATIAFGASVSFAILLIFSPQIISYFSGREVKAPTIVEIIDKGVIFVAPPPDLPPPPLQPVTPPPATASAPVANQTPEVVTHESTDVIPPNNELLNAQPSSGETGTGYVESANPGIVEAPVVAPPTGPVSFAEVMPSYHGGLQAMTKFLSKNLRYPKTASSMGIEGTVFVSFVIDEEGNVIEVKVIRGVSADCDKEAIRVVEKMNEWSPGQMNHNPVAVRMMLPITFKLTR